MKVILSRKGFDSVNGGGPSPILPGDRMLSLPIPQDVCGAGLPYGRIRSHDPIYSKIMRQLEIGRNFKTKGKRTTFDNGTEAHLDPDIDPDALARPNGWRGLFGQSGGAQGHLAKQCVGRGDIFLFFGLFCSANPGGSRTEWQDGDKGRAFHAIFGYLQIDDVRALTRQDEVCQFTKEYGWADYHPHVRGWQQYAKPNNTVYVARNRLSFAPELPGAGILRYSERLRLTRPGCKPSEWQLPRCFGQTAMSFHKPEDWKMAGDYVHFTSAHPGQEFVVKPTEAVFDWVRDLVTAHSRRAEKVIQCLPPS